MKILHVNYSDSIGGAAIAVNRLHNKLLLKNIDSQMLVIDKNINDWRIQGPKNKLDNFINHFKVRLARFVKRNFLKTENKETFSFNLIDTDLLKIINNFKADIVHLHWIGNEMISISQIKKINKPIIWTFWDMWPVNGCEHYSSDKRSLNGYLKDNRNSGETGIDISKYVWNQKLKYFNFKMNIVCPSNWLLNITKKSQLFKKSILSYIPLSIDTNFWIKKSKIDSKTIFNLPKDKIILFGSSSGTNERKGFNFLISAINNLNLKNVTLVIFGEKPKDIQKIKAKYIYVGRVDKKDSLRSLYSSADVIIMPSKLEVFGQIALEGASCSIPSVVFEDTGVTDLIKHKKTGYVAKKNDYRDLQKGIEWCLHDDEILKKISHNVRREVEDKFNDNISIEKYINLYKSIKNS